MSGSKVNADGVKGVRRTPSWLLAFYSNIFFGGANFSIALPTLWPYLRELHATANFLAFAVSIYNVGEGLGGWVVGKLYLKYPAHAKTLLQGGMLVGLLAALLYTLAPLFGKEAAPWIVLAARFLAGIDQGTRQTIEQTGIGQFVPAADQSTATSRLVSFGVTGIMLGPAFAAPLQGLHFELPGVGLSINGNNGPGLVMCIFNTMNIAVTSVFVDPRTLTRQPEADRQADERGGAATAAAPPPSRIGLLTCFVIMFGLHTSMASVETVLPVVAQRLYGWGPCLEPSTCPFQPSRTYVELLMTCGGLLTLLMAVIMSLWLGAKVYGRELLAIAVSLSVSVVANLMNVDWFGSLPWWCFVSSYLLTSFFRALFRTTIFCLLSRIIGPHPKAQYMGKLVLIGAVPRIIGPFVFVSMLVSPESHRVTDFPHVYSGPVPRTWLLYGSQAVIFTVILALLGFARRPIEQHLKELASAQDSGARV